MLIIAAVTPPAMARCIEAEAIGALGITFVRRSTPIAAIHAKYVYIVRPVTPTSGRKKDGFSIHCASYTITNVTTLGCPNPCAFIYP